MGTSTPTTFRRAVAAAFAGLMALGVGACGSSGTTTTQESTTTTAAQAPDTTAAAGDADATATTRRSTGTTRARTTPSTVDDAGTTTTKTVPTVSASPENEPFCQAYLLFAQKLIAQGEATTETSDREAFLATFKEGVKELYEMAPPGTKPDWEILNNALQPISDPTKVSAVLDEPAVDAAGDATSQWARDNCGFDPDEI